MRPRLRSTLLAVALLLAPLAACNRDARPKAADDPEFVQLVDRTVALREAFQAPSGPAPESRAELATLVSDIAAWRKRTGLTDIGASTGDGTRPGGPQVSVVARDGPIDYTCECDFVTVHPRHICLLMNTSDCAGGQEKSCAYVCIDLPGEPVSRWQPAAAS